MDTVTYPDHRVAQFLEANFILARVRVKESQPLVKEYLVSWTPNVVITDGEKVHYRIEGYLPPEDFLAHLSVGLGRYWLNREDFAKARERFEEVTRRHPGTDTAAEALYWLGVARYKESHDPAQLRPSWKKLSDEYARSEWTERANIPGKG